MMRPPLLFMPRVGRAEYLQEVEHLKVQLMELLPMILEHPLTRESYNLVVQTTQDMVDRFNAVTGAHEACSIWLNREAGILHVHAGNNEYAASDILCSIASGEVDSWFGKSYNDQIQ